jgi:hypothetical protein
MNWIGRLAIIGLLGCACLLAAAPAGAAAATHIEAEYAVARIDSATLEAEINPLGEATSCEAQYVTEAEFLASGYAGARTLPCNRSSVGAGTEAVTATVPLTGLSFDATYHYRFLTGDEEGADQTFSTFGIDSFSFDAQDPDGDPTTQAGSHPSQLTTTVFLNTTKVRGRVSPAGVVKDIFTELPAGMVGSATAVPQCPVRLAELRVCPPASQVGQIWVSYGETFESGPAPLYSVPPPRGKAARFSAVLNVSTSAFIDASVRTGGDYGITAGAENIAEIGNTYEVKVKMWGVPGSPTHDSERACGNSNEIGCSSTAPEAPLLIMPTSCSGPLSTDVRADAYGKPGEFSVATAEMPAVTGCNALQFKPTIEARPTTDVADSPTGLHVDLHVPQPTDPEPQATPTLSCEAGTWSGATADFTYRWLRNAVVIPGADEPTYTQSGADAGSVLQCEVEASNGAAGQGLAASREFLARPIPTPPPATRGPEYSVELSSSVDQPSGDTTLRCPRNGFPNSGDFPTATFAFGWFKDGVVAPGETEETLTLSAAEAPFSVQCEVLVSRSGDTTVAFSNVFTSDPAPEPPLPSPVREPRIELLGAGPGLATADLRDAVVKLPPGLTVNPSSANGLEGCTPAQIGLTTPVGTTPIHTTAGPAECPDAAKVGTVEVDTPLLDHPLPGAVYIASPYDNAFESLLAIYITVDDPISGVVIKLAGDVEIGPEGQLTTSFDENPQLPFEDFKLDFFDGPRAALKTGSVCGEFATTSTLTPWSAPESGPPATPGDGFKVRNQPGGGSCPTSADQQPDHPSFEAGSESPVAGAYSPFVLRLSREDGTQQFSSLTVTPPPGLLGKLAGIPYCLDASLAAAAGKTGKEEQASSSCPSASEVGIVNVGAGAGPSPFYVQGHAYLAGPYKGAPLSLAIITPAVAGPYDLGTVVVRSALEIDPFTSQITVKSDQIPTELKGIPLDVRSIAVKMNRSDFTLNPTSCESLAVGGSLATTVGQAATLHNRFQVGGCKQLAFKPKLSISLKGSTKHTGHPALRAVLTYPKKGAYANIARAQVNLPHSEFIEQANLNKTCTKPVLLEGKCPKSTIYGKAKAWTPLLDKPLEGNVFLVGGFGYKLPALVAELNGQIRVLLKGKVDSGPNGGIRNTFEAVPDAPVEKFELNLKGGPKYSLLVNSENLCKKPQKAIARFTGQNGKVLQTKPVIANECRKKSKGKKRKGKKPASREPGKKAKK